MGSLVWSPRKIHTMGDFISSFSYRPEGPFSLSPLSLCLLADDGRQVYRYRGPQRSMPLGCQVGSQDREAGGKNSWEAASAAGLREHNLGLPSR